MKRGWLPGRPAAAAENPRAAGKEPDHPLTGFGRAWLLPNKLLQILRLAFGVLYLSLWFWVFSFAYSSSFFAYNRHSRIVVLVASLAGAAIIFVSAVAQIRSRRAVWRACLRQTVGAVIGLVPLGILLVALPQAGDPWRPTGDDALGMGIDFVLLIGLGITSVLVVGSGLLIRKAFAADPAGGR